MIRDQYIGYLERQYIPYLKNIILDVPFQPIVLRGGKNKPDTTGALHEAGFAMLQEIRQYFSHACSLFMDETTLIHHQAEVETKANRYKGREFPLLHPHEKRAYELLLQHNCAYR